MRDANAALLLEKQEAHLTALKAEGQKQIVKRESEAERQMVIHKAEQQIARDAELQRVLVTRAEHMQESAERKTAIAARESDSDRELLARPDDMRRATYQFPTIRSSCHRDRHPTQWSPALHGGRADRFRKTRFQKLGRKVPTAGRSTQGPISS